MLKADAKDLFIFLCQLAANAKIGAGLKNLRLLTVMGKFKSETVAKKHTRTKYKRGKLKTEQSKQKFKILIYETNCK